MYFQLLHRTATKMLTIYSWQFSFIPCCLQLSISGPGLTVGRTDSGPGSGVLDESFSQGQGFLGGPGEQGGSAMSSPSPESLASFRRSLLVQVRPQPASRHQGGQWGPVTTPRIVRTRHQPLTYHASTNLMLLNVSVDTFIRLYVWYHIKAL